MSEGRYRGPLSLNVCRKVLVEPPLFWRSQGARLPRVRSRGEACFDFFLERVRYCSRFPPLAPPPPRRRATLDLGGGRVGTKRLSSRSGRNASGPMKVRTIVLTTLVSTGTAQTPELATPIGHWRILAKFPMETMTGTIDGQPYEVDDVPYVMYFTNEGHALHGTYWHNNFGTPMSHGCVNLPMDVAEWMYRWAPEGTAVTIIP